MLLDLLKEAHEKSVKLYLNLQDIEMQLQQTQNIKNNIHKELLKLDGEIELLNRMIQEQEKENG